MKDKIIVSLTHEYPPYVFGGMATYSKQLAELLSGSSWKVFVIAGKCSFRKKVSIERASNNLTIIRIYFPEIPPRWLLYTIPAKACLERLLSKYKAIILSNNSLTWPILGNLKGELRKSARCATIFHGSVYSLLTFFQYITHEDLGKINLEELAYYAEAPLVKYLNKNDLCASDRYIFVANHVAVEFKSLYGDMAENISRRGTVIYPGIEYDYLVKLRESIEKVDKDKIIIAYIGRLYYTKGITHAVKALENLVERGQRKEVELWIFGKGPLETWLQHYVKKKGLLQYVRYFKFLERSKLLTLVVRYVDVLLHPSLYEGAPLAIMEAQALGIPVVTYNLPWTSEFVIDGINGYNAPYPDTLKLAEKAVKATHLKSSSIIQVARKYDRKEYFQKLRKLLIELESMLS